MLPPKFCKKCQADTARRSNGQCAVCSRAAAARYRAAHPEMALSSKLKWNERNKDRIKVVKAVWYKANRERAMTMSAAWIASNPAVVKRRSEEYRSNNRQKCAQASATWRADHPASIRLHAQNRRARKREVGGKLSAGLADKLFKLQRGKCACGCKQPLGEDFHLDHIMPLALVGTNTDDNIQLLCATCNLQKHAKHPVDFMQSRGFLL